MVKMRYAVLIEPSLLPRLESIMMDVKSYPVNYTLRGGGARIGGQGILQNLIDTRPEGSKRLRHNLPHGAERDNGRRPKEKA